MSFQDGQLTVTYFRGTEREREGEREREKEREKKREREGELSGWERGENVMPSEKLVTPIALDENLMGRANSRSCNLNMIYNFSITENLSRWVAPLAT